MDKTLEQQVDECVLFLRMNKDTGINIQLDSNKQVGKRIHFPGNLGICGVCMDIPDDLFPRFPEKVWKEAQYQLIMEALQRRADGVES